MTWSVSAGTGPAWLFCPADRPERYPKAAAAADVVILDLEDGVAAADKAFARESLVATPLDPSRTVVRINAAGSADHELDLAALAKTAYTTVMLAKCEEPDQVARLAPLHVVALVETPRGVLGAGAVAAAANTVALMWGAEDLVAGLGGRSSRTPAGDYRSVAIYARSAVLLAAASWGRYALDSVHIDIADLDGLAAEAADAAAIGFSATACIHPSQVDVVRRAYRPTADEATWAQRVLAAARSERGVFTFEGSMVDAPLLRHAEAIVGRSGDSQE
jgi:citrate lyase subunit beta/citryl-CoA lyase